MAEQKEIYRVTWLGTPEEINRILALIADRLDKLEGFRGTPEFQVSPESKEAADEDPELVLFEQLEEKADIDHEHLAVRTVIADYTITADDRTILVDAIAGPISIELPKPFSGPYYVKKIDSTLNPVTIVTPLQETIDGAPTFALEWEDETVRLEPDGSNWFIL
jgi:hypothetical protein